MSPKRINAGTRARAAARDINQTVRRYWRAHREAIATDAGYAAAIAALGASIAKQTRLGDLLSVLLDGLLAVYRALRRDARTA